MKQRQIEDRFFRKVRQCIQRACSTFAMGRRHQVTHGQIFSDRHTTCFTDKAIHLAAKSPALNSTPPPSPNYKSIKTLAHPDSFSPSSNSSSSSSLFCTFISLHFHHLCKYLFFLSPSYYSPFPRFLPLLFLFTPFSSVLSSLLTSQVFGLHNHNPILLFFLFITVQSLPHTTILSHSALLPFSSPSTSCPLR